MACMAAFSSFGQSAGKPFVIDEFYAQKISPDGKWLYGITESDEGVIFNLETMEYLAFYERSLGCGNVFALDGTAVGSNTTAGEAIIIKNGKEVEQNNLNKYWYSNIHGITADGTLAVGVVGNEGSTGGIDDVKQTYLPFVGEVDENGECGNLTILPHPDKDFFGRVPQYSSANWISDDGKTVVGQMVDYSGFFIQPIVYRQDNAGGWSYILPTESIFNPLHIEIPEYPGEFDDSREPNPLNYMTEDKQEEYIEDMEYWSESSEDGSFDEDNYPGDNLDYYMTPEKYAEYVVAMDEYYNYFYEYNDEINAYLDAFYYVIDTSVPFLQNASTLNRQGTLAAFTSRQYVETGDFEPEPVYSIYLYDIEKGELSKIESKYTGIILGQVIADNVVIGSTTDESAYPLCYVYKPGAEDFIPLEEYFSMTNPAAAEWMKENLVHEFLDSGDSGVDPYAAATRADSAGVMVSGYGVASDDFSVFAGGVPAYLWSTTVGYQTYIFGDLTSRVKTVYASDDSALKVLGNGVIAVTGSVRYLAVTDLSGRIMFSANEASGAIETNLNRGIYVVTYTDANGRRLSQKVTF